MKLRLIPRFQKLPGSQARGLRLMVLRLTVLGITVPMLMVPKTKSGPMDRSAQPRAQQTD